MQYYQVVRLHSNGYFPVPLAPDYQDYYEGTEKNSLRCCKCRHLVLTFICNFKALNRISIV